MVGLAEVLMVLALLEGRDGGPVPPDGGGGGGGGSSFGPIPVTPGPAPAPAPGGGGSHFGPIPVRPAPAPAPFPAPVQPQGLPPFPGPQWTACPTTPAIVARAQYWNAILWNFPTKTIRQATAQEQLGGQWVTFKAAWHPGNNGPKTFMATEAYCLGGSQPSPLPSPGPMTGKPAQVGPELVAGGWQSDASYVKRYQAALSWLSAIKSKPAWNTQGVDGAAGPHTQAAVKAFQADVGLVPVDGEAGSATASAIDAMVGYQVPAGGYPPPGSGGGGAQPVGPAAFSS